MVVTVTLNAGLDLTYEAPRFRWGEPNKVERVLFRAGGKGINVARTLRMLGVEAMVTGLAGGRTGEAVREELAEAGIPERLHPIAGESRRTVVAVARDDGEATALNEPGPFVSGEEWRQFVDAFASLLPGAPAVVLAGSLPVGVPADAYATLARAARAHGVPVFLDATGDELLPAVAMRPVLVKPNLAELDAARVPLGNGRHGGPLDRALAGAAALRRLGAAAAVVSIGEDGLVAEAEGARWHAVPPTVRGNPIGAGDAAVAALVAGFLAGEPWPERVRRAAAVSAAAVLAEQAGGIVEEAVPELLAGTLLEEIAAERQV